MFSFSIWALGDLASAFQKMLASPCAAWETPAIFEFDPQSQEQALESEKQALASESNEPVHSHVCLSLSKRFRSHHFGIQGEPTNEAALHRTRALASRRP